MNERHLVLERLKTEQKRRLAKSDLIAFTEYTYERQSGYQAAPHHRELATQLMRVEAGEIDRLMVLMPPRHGKSELVSLRFVAWYLGRHPDRHIISTSANASLAEEFGGKTRDIIRGERYQQIFSTRLREDAQARGRWSTEQGGSYYAVGIGGALMGRGANIAVIDDPFGSMAEARSELERKAVWEWYTGTLYNRLQNPGAIILINHRMHEDDLSGMLLDQETKGGDKWTTVLFKGIQDDGTALWPEMYPIEFLRRIQAGTLPSYFSALYQQNPIPEDGTFFKAAWFKEEAEIPPRSEMEIYFGCDFAVTANGGDYTAIVVVGVDSDGGIWVLDVWRKQASSLAWVEALCDLAIKWKPQQIGVETGQILGALEPLIKRRAQERKAWHATALERFPTKHDKSVRARPIAGYAELKSVHVPQHAAWWADFRAELMAFPAGKHDDQVDAFGLVGQLLDRIVPGQKPKKPDPKEFNDYRDAQETYGGAKDSFLTL